MLKPFVTESLDRSQSDLSRVQDNVMRFAKALEDNPILDGKLLSGQVLATAADTKITHALGRTPRGYLIVGIDGAGDVYQTAADSTTITLHNSGVADVTVSLWIF